MQATRPDTLAVALNDSPAGLLAWLAEKLVEWSDTPAGDPPAVERRISRDRILTEAMIYWVTQSIGSSFRPYYEGADKPGADPAHAVPAAVFIQRHEADYPESLARDFYRDLRVFERLDEGGHFASARCPKRWPRGRERSQRELGLLVSRPSGRETPTLEQRLDLGIPPSEVAVRLERVLRTADPEQAVAEAVAVRAREPAVLAEPLDRVGVEHLAPDVGVVAGAVAAREHVREVGRRVAGRHRGVVEADVGEGGRLERGDVDRRRPPRRSRASATPGRASDAARYSLVANPWLNASDARSFSTTSRRRAARRSRRGARTSSSTSGQ